MTSKLTRAVTQDGSARLIYAETTAIVQRAHEIHETSKTMTAVLGRCLTAASMMGSLLKDKDNVLTLQLKGDGPAGTITCISDYCGNVRGYAQNPTCELPPNAKGKLNVSGAVGHGTLIVMRDLGLGDPYIGQSNIVSGEIAEDITSYFAVSEQTPTVCALGVRCANDNSCTAAGGFLLQLLPNADESLIPILEKNIAALGPISNLIADGLNADDVMCRIFDSIPYDKFDEIDVDYVCQCSRESYARALLSLGAVELKKLIEDDKPVETRCRYCRRAHVFQPEDIRSMIAALEEKNRE